MAWIYILLRALVAWRNLRNMVWLRNQPVPSESRLPKLSVVIPACNEGDTIGPALAAFKKVRYPDLELIVVNDRSTDSTGAVVDRASAADPRIKVVHVQTLPEGWLGKVHALHQGFALATGEWVLFTDADVHFAPDALAKAVGHALASNADHVTLLPELTDRSSVLQGCLIDAVALFFATVPAQQLMKKNSRSFMGAGAFNLVRSDMLRNVGGLQSLRMEVVDDIGLGLVLYEAGARTAFVIGLSEVSIEWYGSLRAFVRGLEKNTFATVGYNYGVATLVAILNLLTLRDLVLTPWRFGGGWFGVAATAALLVAMVVAHIPVTRAAGRKPWFALGLPLAFAVMPWIFARSAFLAWRRGGILWRGTLYPLAQLRKGRRFRIPVPRASRLLRAQAFERAEAEATRIEGNKKRA